MQKKFHWYFELLFIITLFSLLLQLNRVIATNYFNYLIIGQSIILFGYSSLLTFAIFRINQIAKIENQSVSYFFRIRLSINDILIAILLSYLGLICYKLIMKIDLVHIFGVSAIKSTGHFTNLQSWSMILLMALSFPIGVFAEELYFRCYLFEMQNPRYKNHTWIINGFSWSIYHLFTPTNFVAILPASLMYSYVYQKRRNIWITIIAHFINNAIVFYSAYKSLRIL